MPSLRPHDQGGLQKEQSTGSCARDATTPASISVSAPTARRPPGFWGSDVPQTSSPPLIVFMSRSLCQAAPCVSPPSPLRRTHGKQHKHSHRSAARGRRARSSAGRPPPSAACGSTVNSARTQNGRTGRRRTTGTWDCGGPAARKPLPEENSKDGYCAPGLFLLRMCARALSEPRNEFEYTACVRRQGECVSVGCGR